MFTPSRLTLARQRRGFTKQGLAEMIGLTSRSVIAYEAGDQEPAADTLERLAKVLDFPPQFFSGSEVDEIDAGAASFRALKSMTARQRDASLAAGSLAVELANWVGDRFQLQAANIPPDCESMEPEVAADTVRAHWKLGERPIGNVVHLLELHGVRVFSLVEECVEVDAFSFWRDDVPFVFINTMKSPERSRYDAAHELGHLVLHRSADRGREAELDANRFASAFLMPRGAILASAPRYPSLPNLLQGKRPWNVSVAAFAHRLHAVDLMTDWQYRMTCIELSSRGFRKDEPDSSGVRETSQVWSKVLAALREDGITKTDIAAELRLPVREIDALVFGLVKMGSIEGGRTGRGGIARRGHLKVV